MRPDAAALYEALLADGSRLSSVRRLQYRCPSRCLLLDAIEVGGTILLHQNRYKLSPGHNEARSSASGRAANTFDGATHWKPRTYWITDSALAYPDTPSMRLQLQCDHVGVDPDASLTAVDFAEDWTAGATEVTNRHDGSRFTVR